MKFKILFISLVLAIFLSKSAMAEPKSTGKYKNWQSFVTQTDKGKICFAQTVPVKRAPKNIKRQEMQNKLYDDILQRLIMNLSFSDEDLKFQSEVRSFIKDTYPADIKEKMRNKNL